MPVIILIQARIGRGFVWLTDFFCGPDGRPSNPKVMSWAVYLAFVLNHPIPVTVVAILIAASFGIKTFQMWLQKATFAASSTDSVNLAYASATSRTITETVQRHEWADGSDAGIA